MNIPQTDPLANERGAALVTALLVMVILTIMGTVAMTIRNTEQSIVVNSEVFQHNFYTLEAVTFEGAHLLDNLGETPYPSVLLDPSAFPAWLKEDPTKDPALEMFKQVNWPSGQITPATTSFDGSGQTVNTNFLQGLRLPLGADRIQYAAIDRGVCKGGSLSPPPGRPQERCYDVYGMYDVKRGAGKAYSGHQMLQIGFAIPVSLN